MLPDDVPAVAAFAIEGMRVHKYPGLRVSEPKVRAVVEHFERSHSDFHLCAFKGDELVGAIAAAVVEMPFFERYEAHVVMCRAVEPGSGERLISSLRTWADRDMRIRRVQWPQEFDARPGVARIAARHGFTQRNTNCIYYKS